MNDKLLPIDVVGSRLATYQVYFDSLFMTFVELKNDQEFDVDAKDFVQSYLLVCDNPWRFIRNNMYLLGIEDVYELISIKGGDGKQEYESSRVIDVRSRNFWGIVETGEFDLLRLQFDVRKLNVNEFGDLAIQFTNGLEFYSFACGSTGKDWVLTKRHRRGPY